MRWTVGYKFSPGDRVIVVAEEPDKHIRDSGIAIPIGTTGSVRRWSGNDKNPETEMNEDFFSVVFDIPYTGLSGHLNVDGFTCFDMFESMIDFFDDPVPVIDIDGIFEE